VILAVGKRISNAVSRERRDVFEAEPLHRAVRLEKGVEALEHEQPAVVAFKYRNSYVDALSS
jgi:hypothetical protein